MMMVVMVQMMRMRSSVVSMRGEAVVMAVGGVGAGVGDAAVGRQRHHSHLFALCVCVCVFNHRMCKRT